MARKFDTMARMGLRNGVWGLGIVFLACCKGDAALPLVNVEKSPVAQGQGALLWSSEETKLTSKAESLTWLEARRTADELLSQERESVDSSHDAWIERRSQALLAVEALSHTQTCSGGRVAPRSVRAVKSWANRDNFPECVGSTDPLCGL